MVRQRMTRDKQRGLHAAPRFIGWGHSTGYLDFCVLSPYVTSHQRGVTPFANRRSDQPLVLADHEWTSRAKLVRGGAVPVMRYSSVYSLATAASSKRFAFLTPHINN